MDKKKKEQPDRLGTEQIRERKFVARESSRGHDLRKVTPLFWDCQSSIIHLLGGFAQRQKKDSGKILKEKNLSSKKFFSNYLILFMPITYVLKPPRTGNHPQYWISPFQVMSFCKLPHQCKKAI